MSLKMVTILAANLGFYQELKISLKPQEIIIFCASHVKQHIN